MHALKNLCWWQTGIIYQVYPRSFQDSNGDGIGDLRGIIQRLDYLQWLGINAIWVSPVFTSPMADFGYDISDYKNIDPIFGSLMDFDDLLKEIHSRKMKLIIDLVPNHSSDQHPWFIESRSSRDNPKRNWYIWRNAKPDGSAPNNWLSVFGGSAWEWDEKTNQYYYHAFLKQQPDLNYKNPKVLDAMLEIMRFWLDKGVDGFRVDVMWHLIKDDQFRDNPSNPDYRENMLTYDSLLPAYSTDQPEVHYIVQKMRNLLDDYRERMMIGEIYLPVDRMIAYYGTAENRGVHLPFNFMLIALPWDAAKIAAAVDKYEGLLPANGWPNWVLGNHDQPRITSRVGLQQAKIAAMLLLTLRGTPTIYYGDEIGMTDVPIPFNEVKDPQGLNMPEKNLTRDPGRTPMQWEKKPKAGFTSGTPWLRVDKAYQRVNVEVEKSDAYSMLTLYKELITLRQSNVSLQSGNYAPVYSDSQVISYTRHAQGSEKFLIVLNFSHRPSYYLPKQYPFRGVIAIATSPEIVGTKVENTISLAGDEGMIIQIE